MFVHVSPEKTTQHMFGFKRERLSESALSNYVSAFENRQLFPAGSKTGMKRGRIHYLDMFASCFVLRKITTKISRLALNILYSSIRP